eukprot:1616120-Karenia_brevis.AAC.1
MDMAKNHTVRLIFSGIQLETLPVLVERNYNMIAAPPNDRFQNAIPYGSELVTGAGVRFIVSDKTSTPPCGV